MTVKISVSLVAIYVYKERNVIPFIRVENYLLRAVVAGKSIV